MEQPSKPSITDDRLALTNNKYWEAGVSANVPCWPRLQPAFHKQKSKIAAVPNWDYTDGMRVIAVSTLRDFWQRYPDAEQPLKAWHEEATNATWTQPADIKVQYRSASVLKNRRVVFNIKGSDYRLIVAVAYKLQVVYVKFVGTHKEYDAVDAETIDMA
jgi:mRNA interferase HigB